MTLIISRHQNSRDPQPRPTVKEVQTLLNRKNSRDISVDGVFGLASEAAVKTFQRRAGLTTDGVVGPKTWAALIGATSPTPKPSLCFLFDPPSLVRRHMDTVPSYQTN